MVAIMRYADIIGNVSLISISVLSVIYAYFGFLLQKHNNRKSALQLMFYSFLYLPISLVLILIDKV